MDLCQATPLSQTHLINYFKHVYDHDQAGKDNQVLNGGGHVDLFYLSKKKTDKHKQKVNKTKKTTAKLTMVVIYHGWMVGSESKCFLYTHHPSLCSVWILVHSYPSVSTPRNMNPIVDKVVYEL